MRRHQRRPHPLTLARSRRSARGITLVELMLGTALGIVMLGSAVLVLLAGGRMRRNQQLLADANEEARTALRQVSRVLSAAGAGGPVYAFMDEAGARRQRPALIFTNGAKALNAPAMPQTPDELILLRYAADRRTVLVKELAGTQVSVAPDARLKTTPGVEPEVFLDVVESALITNFQRAMLLPFTTKKLGDGDAPGTAVVQLDTGTVDPAVLQDAQIPIEPGATVFPVRVIRYRVVHVPAAGNVPERADLVMEALNPRTLGPLEPPQRTVLARDIEDFQVQWAYDRNDDGVADGGYTDEGPTDTRIDPGLTFARITLSARTSNPLITEEGEYVTREETPFERGIDLGGARPPASGYRRRVLSTVVLLKNLAAPRI